MSFVARAVKEIGMSKTKKSDIDAFIALPDSEKDRIVNEIETESPAERLSRSRPLNAKERAVASI